MAARQTAPGKAKTFLALIIADAAQKNKPFSGRKGLK